MEINFRADREVHLRKLCEEMGRTVDDFVNEAILTFMEDYEDGREALAAMSEAERTHYYSTLEVRRELGLDSVLHTEGAKAA